MKILGVTACPTGIAHTYMAAAQVLWFNDSYSCRLYRLFYCGSPVLRLV